MAKQNKEAAAKAASEAVAARETTAREVAADSLSGASREQQDISQSRQIVEAVGNQNDKRVALYNEIADNLDKLPARAMIETDGDNLGSVESSGGDPSAATERAAQEAEAAAEAERERLEAEQAAAAARAEQEAPGTQAADTQKRYKIKVNGKEIELTEQEVLERASKVEAADEYLQSAKRVVEGTQASRPSEKDGPASVGEDDIEDTLTSALQGDKEAIKKVAQRLKTPSVNTDALVAVVDDRSSFRSAADWFRGEYKDLVKDPMLYRLVVDEDSRLAKAEPRLDYRERLKRAGDHVRNWKQGLTTSAAGAAPLPNPKLAAKAQVAPVPQAGGRQVQQEEPEENESVESIIDKMARARHKEGAIRRQ